MQVLFDLKLKYKRDIQFSDQFLSISEIFVEIFVKIFVEIIEFFHNNEEKISSS